jgi:hypothetical protein
MKAALSSDLEMGRQNMGKPTNWELKLTATSLDEAATVLRLLTGAVVGSGGWVLSRTIWDGGGEISFEFERRACLDMYTVLIAAGLELSQHSHLQLTNLCQCTRNAASDLRFDLARIDLKIQTDEIGSALAELARP